MMMTSEKLNKLFANYTFKARSINTKTNTLPVNA